MKYKDLRRYILDVIIEYSIFSEIEMHALARVVSTYNRHLDKSKII